MFVLLIIGICLVYVLLYLIIKRVNRYTSDRYNYDFFNIVNLSIISISYVLIFIGYKWYEKALKINSDLLNGQVLIGMGIIILFSVLYINIKRTKFIFGFLMSLVQMIFYIPISLIVLLIIFIVASFFANTRPVYKIN